MAFEIFDRRQLPLVKAALSHAKKTYGKNGLKLETQIDASVRWRPTFFLKPNSALIVAFEYNDVLYPDALDGAIVDLGSFERPVTVYQLCPLSSFQADRHQERTRLLTERGIGIITIDDDTMKVDIQRPGVPLGQNISESELTKALRDLPPRLKILFRIAHESFQTNVGQGLQQAGQIVEAIVRQVHDHQARQGKLAAAKASEPAANLTDQLFNYGPNSGYRPVLGGTRKFIGEFRNTASHPSKTAKDAVEKIRKCRAGFLDAINLASGLCEMARKIRCKLQVHVT